MSQNAGNYQEDAREAKECARLLKIAMLRIRAYLRRNAVHAWDHTTGTPAYRQVDADGNVKGVDFTPAELSNAINSFEQMRKLMDNESPTIPGDYWGNVEKLADA